MESDKSSSSRSSTPREKFNPLTTEMVKAMTGPSDKILCLLRDNTYIRFGAYSIKDYDSGLILMHITEEQQSYADKLARKEEDEGKISLETRTVKYEFGADFLELKTLALSLEFYVVGDDPISDLLFIERHYFKDQLLSSFEFQFPFCMGRSKNQCEFVYKLPELTEEQKHEMIRNPWQATSDSFFFANGQLIIHNKAAYNYQS